MQINPSTEGFDTNKLMKINSRKSPRCNLTVSEDIKFLLSTNLNLISNKAVNENSNLFFKISTKIIG